MRLIRLSEYDEQTMQLAKPIYDGMGRVLLAANAKIHPKFNERLVKIGISYIVVEDAESQGVTLEEMLDMPAWLDMIQIVREAFEAAAHQNPLPLRSIYQGVDKLIDEVKRRPIVVSIPVTTIADDLQIYAHSVNVALLSLQVAKQIGYNDLQLRDLALGCLLHDIGKAAAQERKVHPEAGFNILRSVREISLLSAHIAFQHHETIDGKGYPRGISGKELHEYAQICSITNLFDNLLTQQNMLPHDAIEVIMALNGKVFGAPIVLAFVKAVAPYPPGTKVMLSNGERAIVTKIVSHMQRPFVRTLSTGQEISLAEHPTLMITGKNS